MEIKNRIEEALTKASTYNEKDAERLHRLISRKQRELQDQTEMIKKIEEERKQTLAGLEEIFKFLLEKTEEGMEIDALFDLIAKK